MKRFVTIVVLTIIVVGGAFVGPRIIDAQSADGDEANKAAIEALATAVAANDVAVQAFATAVAANDVAVQAFATAVAVNAEPPVPEPTAEPTVDPEPVVLCDLVIDDADDEGLFSLPVTQAGEWVLECSYPLDLQSTIGGSAASGERYYRDLVITPLTLDVTWVATLSSDEDTFMLLWEYEETDDGIADGSFRLVDTNDDLESGNTNSRIEWSPTADKTYLLVLTTYEIETLGSFTLTITAGSATVGNSTGMQELMPVDVPGDMRFEQQR